MKIGVTTGTKRLHRRKNDAKIVAVPAYLPNEGFVRIKTTVNRKPVSLFIDGEALDRIVDVVNPDKLIERAKEYAYNVAKASADGHLELAYLFRGKVEAFVEAARLVRARGYNSVNGHAEDVAKIADIMSDARLRYENDMKRRKAFNSFVENK